MCYGARARDTGSAASEGDSAHGSAFDAPERLRFTSLRPPPAAAAPPIGRKGRDFEG
jgi:hypothetical protein